MLPDVGTRAGLCEALREVIDLIHEPAWSASTMSGEVKQAFGW